MPPIIIIGMHRSGTSMIARTLESLGLYVGNPDDRHPVYVHLRESSFFMSINHETMRKSNSDWNNPRPLLQSLRDPDFQDAWIKKTTARLNRKQEKFLGRRYKRRTTPFALDIPWGWKDPRNTFTLPLWLKIFPEAKILHIYRHGVDAAHSLLVRQNFLENRTCYENFRSRVIRYSQWRNMKFLRKNWRDRKAFTRVLSLEGAFSLWEEYMRESRKHASYLGNRALEIKYEDLLLKPSAYLEALSAFCGLSPSVEILDAASKTINTDRRFPYRRDKKLREFAAQMDHRLRRFGYGDDWNDEHPSSRSEHRPVPGAKQ